jgi:aldehyde:ferredoxin oxidoreductase
MVVKGLELPACDPRASAGAALAYGTSTCGARLPGAFTVQPEALRAAGGFDGAADRVRAAEDSGAVADSLAVCPLASPAVSPGLYARLLAGATGLPYTGQGLMKTGEEIIGLEREYNERNGFGEQDDLLPERFFTEAGTPGEGIEVPPVDRKRYLEELERYNRLRKYRPPDGGR